MSIKLSPELRSFLQQWLNWVAIGAPSLKPFRRSQGLCFSAALFDRSAWEQNISQATVHDELIKLIKKEFGSETILPNGGGPMWIYPFGGCDRYSQEYETKTMHLNQERIDWVRKMLEQADGN